MISRLARSILFLTVVATATVVGSGAAWADCGDNPVNSHYETFTHGNGSEYASWDSGVGDGVSSLSVITQNLVSGRCLDIWHDWSTTGGHYDARTVRDCSDNSRRDNWLDDGDYDEPDTDRTLTGQNRGGACTYIISTETFLNDNCDQTPVAYRNSGCLVQDVVLHPGNGVHPDVEDWESARQWIRYANGSIDIVNQPSDPTSPTM